MSTTPTPESFLTGGGARSAKFETPGATVTGTVVDQEVRQQTEFGTGKPLFWDNGDPQMQLVVRLQTTSRDDAEDDGIRAIYIKGGFKKPTMQKAVADACRNAGVKGLEVGGTLTITYTGDGPKEGSGFPPKYYSASYTPPTAAFLEQQQQTTTPAAPSPTSTQLPAQPAPVTVPMVTLPDGSQVTPEVAALINQVQPQAASA